jgi:hypothetical protein
MLKARRPARALLRVGTMAGAVPAGHADRPDESNAGKSDCFLFAKAAAAKEGADGLVRANADLRASAPKQPPPCLRLCFPA